jgi:cell division protein FtsI/penicillin-binding protein 2
MMDAPGMLDRARYGLYPPGSTFKLVTAVAALRKDPALEHAVFACRRLPDGRVGNIIPGWSRPIRDDVADTVPHGKVDMEKATGVSCNAYFAQLGMRTGAASLMETARLFDIVIAQPETEARVRANLPQTSYGQAEVLATPFKMARVAAAIASGGTMPFGHWVNDATDRRNRPPVNVTNATVAADVARFMRGVVTDGTARSLRDILPPVAGKTGTAEVQQGPSHAWFAGFAPYGGAAGPPGRRIAFAVIIENGGYGGRSATPVAAEIVAAARELGYIGGK